MSFTAVIQTMGVSTPTGGANICSTTSIVAAAVLAVTIVARFAWVMSYGALMRWLSDHADVARRPKTRPTVASGVVVSWAGMRGIVTLEAAFAIPKTLRDGSPFPYRDHILLCAFAMVLGTLVVQGMTIAPLIRRLGLTDDDSVGHEVRIGRAKTSEAMLQAIEGDDSLAAKLLRKEYGAVVELNTGSHGSARPDQAPGAQIRRQAIAAGRQRAFELRRDEVIGDDAYRVLVQERDWAELSAGGGRQED